MKQIQPIRNKKDCDAATREIERLMEKETSKKLTKAEAARLEVLATLVDAYESALVQDVPPDPIEALKFRLEQLGLPLADLARTLGSRPRASEVLSRKRRMDTTDDSKDSRGIWRAARSPHPGLPPENAQVAVEPSVLPKRPITDIDVGERSIADEHRQPL